MRYLKLASAKNPDDFIELNDFNGFLCTSFQTIGISRKLEFLAIKNRQLSVENKMNFKKYNLIVEILTKYSEYERKHRELITFLDRNKKEGFRLYFRSYEGMELRYCLCDIETSSRPEKMQPIILTLTQNSLWLGEEKKFTIGDIVNKADNLFSFDNRNGYYSTSFSLDEKVSEGDYYCISFNEIVSTEGVISNNSYSEVPLHFIIYGKCVNPTILLYKQGENKVLRKTQIIATINEDYYIEINADIINNGVWYVNKNTGERIDYSEAVNNEYGSPYLYVDNGDYIVKVQDDAGNACITKVFLQEGYNE